MDYRCAAEEKRFKFIVCPQVSIYTQIPCKYRFEKIKAIIDPNMMCEAIQGDDTLPCDYNDPLQHAIGFLCINDADRYCQTMQQREKPFRNLRGPTPSESQDWHRAIDNCLANAEPCFSPQEDVGTSQEQTPENIPLPCQTMQQREKPFRNLGGPTPSESQDWHRTINNCLANAEPCFSPQEDVGTSQEQTPENIPLPVSSNCSHASDLHDTVSALRVVRNSVRIKHSKVSTASGSVNDKSSKAPSSVQ